MDTGEQTICVIMTFILAMLHHPAVYRRLQAEIDGAVGRERLPQLDDRRALPYMECVLKEVYRYVQVLPPKSVDVRYVIRADDHYPHACRWGVPIPLSESTCGRQRVIHQTHGA